MYMLLCRRAKARLKGVLLFTDTGSIPMLWPRPSGGRAALGYAFCLSLRPISLLILFLLRFA